MPLIYSSILTESHVSSIASKHHFTDKLTVEKFIMDYEMHHHITDVVDCTTRGGMCMPFHTSSQTAKRLSIDIDLLTSASIVQIRQIMENIPSKVNEVRCEEMDPKDPYPLDNLISYRVHYNSCLGGSKFIKVDFFCDVNSKLDTNTIPKGYSLFAFNTNKEIPILSKGALIADKITTLGLDTIGLKPTRQTEIAKQIYDIGVLMKSSSLKDLESALETFQTLTSIKIEHFDHTPKFTLSDIVKSIDGSVSSFINFQNAVSITGKHEKRYNDFKGTYLSTTADYKKTEHVSDVLLIKIFAQHLNRLINGEPISEVAKSFFKIISELNSLSGSNNTNQIRSSLMQQFPTTLPFKKNILPSAKLEHVLLLKEISW